ncbi:MAG: tetratricopeptide repeat protein, partial [Bacteroidia bacterium]|nr:tetratricopeptide repeat protein [Bacteroidia bacterium]
VISSFKDPIVTYQARLWIFQCLYYQGKYEEAESLIVGLKNDQEFPKALNTELYKGLGAIMLKNQKNALAAEYLQTCLTTAKGRMERFRLHFALAQALQSLAKYEESAKHYAKVVRMTPPYDMAFNARINQVEILSLQQKDYAKANKLLRRMLKDDKNLEYFGQIYHKMGLNELRAGNVSKGLTYLNKSLAESKNDKAQATTTYLTLGDFYYERRVFDKSATYYDSANQLLDERHPNYESISKKSLKLSELLRHLLVIKKQDSLLKLARDPVLREKTIDRLIELESKQAQVKTDNPGTNNAPPDPGNNNTNNTGNSSFPFYNMASRQRGITEFQKNWGERANRDYWNINSKKSTQDPNGPTNPDEINKDSSNNLPTNVDANRKKYYKDIPSTPEAQAAAETKIEEALMAAAGVYQNSFGELETAIDYYKDLLSRYPTTKYEAQALFEIAKMHKSLGNSAAYTEFKNKLQSKHPESIYLKLLDDPNALKNNTGGGSAKKEIEDLYEKMYALYLTDKFEAALAVKKEADSKFAGNVIQGKFDLLAGICHIKLNNPTTGIAALKQVMDDYPSTPYADKAADIVEAWNKKQNPVSTNDTSTVAPEVAGLWQKWDGTEEILYIITYQRGANSNLIRAALNDFNKENFIYESLEVSPAAAVGETIYLTVANFSKTDVSIEYLKLLMNKADFFASKGLFEYEMAWITKTNYTTLIKSNRINSYFDFFKTDKK